METLITQGQKKQVGRFITDGAESFLENLSIRKDVAQKVIERGGELQAAIKAAVERAIYELSGVPIFEWTLFYRDFFGLDVDLSGVRIPGHRNGFNRMIVVANELFTASNGKPYMFIIEAMKKHFPVCIYADDLDKVIVKNDRQPDKMSYAVCFRDRVEADEELKNLSADDLAKRNIQGITCLERLLYELKYFAETGKNLDIDNWTLCSGSRVSDGDVPSVSRRGVGVFVCCDHSSGAVDHLRSRSAAV